MRILDKEATPQEMQAVSDSLVKNPCWMLVSPDGTLWAEETLSDIVELVACLIKEDIK